MSASSAQEKVPSDWDNVLCVWWGGGGEWVNVYVVITHHFKQLVTILGELKTLLILVGRVAVRFICT
jgi:hypothetical protein